MEAEAAVGEAGGAAEAEAWVSTLERPIAWLPLRPPSAIPSFPSTASTASPLLPPLPDQTHSQEHAQVDSHAQANVEAWGAVGTRTTTSDDGSGIGDRGGDEVRGASGVAASGGGAPSPMRPSPGAVARLRLSQLHSNSSSGSGQSHGSSFRVANGSSRNVLGGSFLTTSRDNGSSRNVLGGSFLTTSRDIQRRKSTLKHGVDFNG